VTALSVTQVRATFSEAMSGADNAANYTCSAGLSVTGAVRISDTDYTLTTELQGGVNYTLTAGSGIHDLAGNSVDPAAASQSFTGIGSSSASHWRLYR